MPAGILSGYTEEQRKAVLKDSGYDPNKYTLTDDGELQEVAAQPVLGLATTASEPSSSAPGAFVKSASAGVLPALGAWGAAAGANVALDFLYPPAGAIVHILTALGGGLAGGAAVRKAQDLAMPQAWKENLEQARQEHPTASTLGEVTSGLAAGKPTVAGTKSLISGIGKAPGYAISRLGGPLSKELAPRLSAAELGALQNAGIGVGLGAGQEAYQAITNPDYQFDPLNAALGIVPMATFTTPTRLGRFVSGQGFGKQPVDLLAGRDLGNRTSLTGLEFSPLAKNFERVNDPAVARAEAIAEQQKLNKATAEVEAQKTVIGKLAELEAKTEAIAKAKQQESLLAKQKRLAPTLPVKIENLEEAPVTYSPDLYEDMQARMKASKSLQSELKKQAKLKSQIETETTKQETARLESELENTRKEGQTYAKGLRGNEGQVPEGGNVLQGSEGQSGKNLEQQTQGQPSGEKGKEGARIQPGEIQDEIIVKAPTPKKPPFAPEDIVAATTGVPALPEIPNLGVKGKTVDPLLRVAINSVAKQHGMTVREDGIVTSADGKRILGSFDPKTKKIKLSIAEGKEYPLDVPGHELSHGLQAELSSEARAERDAIVEKWPEYTKWKGEREAKGFTSDPGEYIAYHAGKEVLDRFYNTRGESKLGRYIRDLKASWKLAGGKPDSEEFIRMFTKKLTSQERPLVKKGEPGKIIITPKEEKSSEESALPSFSKGVETPTPTPTTPTKEAEEHLFRKAGLEPTNERYSFPGLGKLASSIDKVKSSISEKLANEWAKTFSESTTLNGEFVEGPKEIVSKNWTKSEMDRARTWLQEENLADLRGTPQEETTYSTGDLTPREKELVDYAREWLYHIKDKANEAKIRGGLAEKNPRYFPAMPDRDILDIMTSGRDLAKSRYYKDLWRDHLAELDYTKDRSPEEKLRQATEDVNNYLQAMVTADYANPKWAALYERAGRGMPLEMQEKNLLAIMTRYGRRTGKSIAYAKWILNNPDRDIPALMGVRDENGVPVKSENVKEPVASTKEVNDVVKFFNGEVSKTNLPRINNMSKFITNLKLGLATGLRDTAALGSFISPYTRTFQDVKAVIKGAADFHNRIQESLEAGARTKNLNDIDWGILNDPDHVANFFDKLAYGARKFQGRDAIEQFNREVTYGIGREFTRLKLIEARGGNKKAIEFLEKVGDTVDNLEGKIKDPTLLQEDDLRRMAKAFTERVQGTYDARGLPLAAMGGSLGPFLAMSRWSIEKANVIYKDTIKPAQNGDFKPLLVYTLGAVLTGEGIRKLNTFLQGEMFGGEGKKPDEPSLKEATVSEEQGRQLAQYAASIAQLGSYGGIVSDILKGISDLSLKGQMPRGLSFPAADFLSETLTANSVDAISAIRQGADPMTTLLDYLHQTLKSSVQGYNILAANVMEQDNIPRQNKFRDLRVFKRGEGDFVPSIDSARPNRFLAPEAREFKRASEPSEIIEALPKAREEAITRAGGDTEQAIANLRGLKQNSYQTMPNPETKPLEFHRYYEYLVETQGAEEASKRLVDYFNQREINKVKGELVGKF